MSASFAGSSVDKPPPPASTSVPFTTRLSNGLGLRGSSSKADTDASGPVRGGAASLGHSISNSSGGGNISEPKEERSSGGGLFSGMGSLTRGSVVERVANALSKCSASAVGAMNHSSSSSSSSNASGGGVGEGGAVVPPPPPEKPNRILSLKNKLARPNSANNNSHDGGSNKSQSGNTSLLFGKSPKPVRRIIRMLEIRTKKSMTLTELWQDEKFLNALFRHFGPLERTILAQVCSRWKTILYANTKQWVPLMPVVHFRQLPTDEDRLAFYRSIQIRGFDSVALAEATDNDLKDFSQFMLDSGRSLRLLSLRSSPVSDHGLLVLSDNLSGLRQLDINSCNEVTETGLWNALHPKITALSISDCINIGDESVRAVTQRLPALHEFTLQAYHVTDHALAYFNPKHTNTLAVLRLHSCWEITNHGLVNLAGALSNLTSLSLSGCSKISDEGIEVIAEHMRRLKCLDLSWCPRLTDAALEYIACDLGQLEELALDRCILVTDIGLGYLSTMVTITFLSLRWCPQIRDFGMQHICGMRNLRILFLAGCSLLSPSGLSNLAQLPFLAELELTNCPGATPELISFLRENAPKCEIYR